MSPIQGAMPASQMERLHRCLSGTVTKASVVLTDAEVGKYTHSEKVER